MKMFTMSGRMLPRSSIHLGIVATMAVVCLWSRPTLAFSIPTMKMSFSKSSTQLFLEKRPIWSNHTSSTKLAAHSSSRAVAPPHNFQIYCDLDGVLVDFEKGIQLLFQQPSSQLSKEVMWKYIEREPNFFQHLPWTSDGKHLWQAIQHLTPDILTGVPEDPSSRTAKWKWCRRELTSRAHHVDMAADEGHELVNGNKPKEGAINVITCWSNYKHMECQSAKE